MSNSWLDGWASGFLACAWLMAPHGKYSRHAELRDEMLAIRARAGLQAAEATDNG